jgi:phage gpG-like protein
MNRNFINKLLSDLRVELLDEFDRNFERKAFFTKPWPARRLNTRGSLLVVRGGAGLRGSLRAQTNNDNITFSSNQPHAALHNEGGTITVTAKMKRYFWARYKELEGKKTYNIKTRKIANTRRMRNLNEAAEFFKAMALMKVGDKITMPERRFIGHAPEVDQAVKRVADAHFNQLETYLKNILKPR